MKKLLGMAIIFTLLLSGIGCSESPKRGIVVDGVYTNDYFKLSFTIPEGWNAFTDEEVFERAGISLPNDEDLANSKIEFADVFFYITVDQKDRIRISYSNLENTTDEQIKNRLSAQNSDVEFGNIDFIKIGEVDYAMISGSSSDGALNYYHVWGLEVYGYLRPVIYMQLDSGDSVYNYLDNFAQIAN